MMSAEDSGVGADLFSPTWTFEVPEGPLHTQGPFDAQEDARAV